MNYDRSDDTDGIRIGTGADNSDDAAHDDAAAAHAAGGAADAGAHTTTTTSAATSSTNTSHSAGNEHGGVPGTASAAAAPSAAPVVDACEHIAGLWSNCAACGRPVCKVCVAKGVALPAVAVTVPLRCCKPCVRFLNGITADAAAGVDPAPCPQHVDPATRPKAGACAACSASAALVYTRTQLAALSALSAVKSTLVT